jgi:hypothetical protein
MINSFGIPELLITVVSAFLVLIIGLGFPIALILLLVQINKRLKSIEEFLKRDA